MSLDQRPVILPSSVFEINLSCCNFYNAFDLKKNIQFALDNLCYGAVLSPRLWRTQQIAMEMFCTCTEITLLFSEFFSITGQNSLVISPPVIHKILTMISIQRCVTGTDEMLTLLPLHFLQSHNLALQALLLYA